ncbi:helix-turn-helix transcriptional regulator [uncultured Maribacter sp.]|uniref:AraC family transcriptional regulator n=1 Tax=uncultured Maribacter sp. TaxID=431308 RepID=UPI00263013E4|nr:helix-turn-helix transcriptional regulator [uncultured Maribacter sp.]
MKRKHKQIPIVHIDQEWPMKFVIRKSTIVDFQDLPVSKPHRHNFYYLLFVQKGTGSHNIDFNAYPIAENTFFFLKPGQVHQVQFTSPAQGYLIQFNREFYNSAKEQSNMLIRKLGRKSHYVFSKKGFEELEKILNTILREYNEKAFNYRYSIKSYVDILFTEIIRHGYNKISNMDSENLYHQERFEELMEKVEISFTTHKKVSDYAKMMNLTSYQLNAITKAMVGATCSKLINAQIILEAKRSLLATSNQINEVAFALGYDDPSYFIRFFKKNTGRSPESFRQEFKQL